MLADPWWRLVQEALWLSALLAAPAALAALGAGLLVSVLVATTRVRETTLSAAPKAAAALGALLIAGAWMAEQWVRFSGGLWLAIEGVCR
ncbi:MAG: flagellar biosynthetic protein FliQ [Planctomycetota bacterium]